MEAPLQNLSLQIDRGVATVTIDRPPVNALDSATLDEITALFRDINENRDIRAVVLTAAGTRAFIAGADLKDVRTTAEGRPKPTDPGLQGRSALEAVWNCAVPVIVAVNGPAIGGGVSFVSMCDVIFAAPEATFSAPEINVGLLGGCAHLARLVGTFQARRMYLTGDSISARALFEQGVITRIVPRDSLLADAQAFAQDLAKKSPVALRLAKEVMGRIEGLPVTTAYRLEQDYTTRLLTFEDAAEARNAFLEKRAPEWKLR
jgi:enoyl-CoA hydratase